MTQTEKIRKLPIYSGVGVVIGMEKTRGTLEDFAPRLKQVVLKVFKITEKEFEGQKHPAPVTGARFICYYLTKLYYDKYVTLSGVPKLYGFRKHHSSVINGIQQVENMLAVKSGFYDQFVQVAEELGIDLITQK